MKKIIIFIILFALGYYIFFYEAKDTMAPGKTTDENQEIRNEFDIEQKTYQGALTEVFDNAKNKIDGAKAAVAAIEKKSQLVLEN